MKVRRSLPRGKRVLTLAVCTPGSSLLIYMAAESWRKSHCSCKNKRYRRYILHLLSIIPTIWSDPYHQVRHCDTLLQRGADDRVGINDLSQLCCQIILIASKVHITHAACINSCSYRFIQLALMIVMVRSFVSTFPGFPRTWE